MNTFFLVIFCVLMHCMVHGTELSLFLRQCPENVTERDVFRLACSVTGFKDRRGVVVIYRKGEEKRPSCTIRLDTVCHFSSVFCGCSQYGDVKTFHLMDHIATPAQHDGDWFCALAAEGLPVPIFTRFCPIQVLPQPRLRRDVCTNTVCQGGSAHVSFQLMGPVTLSEVSTLAFYRDDRESRPYCSLVASPECEGFHRPCGCIKGSPYPSFHLRLDNVTSAEHSGQWSAVLHATYITLYGDSCPIIVKNCLYRVMPVASSASLVSPSYKAAGFAMITPFFAWFLRVDFI